MLRLVPCVLFVLVVWAVPTAYTQPCEPRLAGGLGGGSVGDLVVRDGVAYLARGRGVQVISLADPASPSVLSFFPLADTAEELVIQGHLLYVRTGLHGTLVVLDVSDPSEPRHEQSVGYWSTEQFGGGFVVGGGVAFFAARRGGILSIVDTRDPGAPVERGHRPTLWDGVDVAFVPGSRTFVTVDYDKHGEPERHAAFLLDHSDPTDIQWLASVDLPETGNEVVVSDGVGYIASDGLRAFDISNPSSPYPLGVFEQFAIRDFTVRGSVYAVSNRGSLAVLDKNTLELVAEIALPYFGATDIAVESGRAYVACDTSDTGLSTTLLSYDITDRARPRLIGQLDMAEAIVERLAKVGQTIVAVSGGWGWVSVIDASDPTQPRRIESGIDLPASNDVVAVGDLITLSGLAGDRPGVHLYDFSDPQSPFLRTAVSLPGSLWRVAADGTLLYVQTLSDPASGYAGGLEIYDTRDPEAVQHLGGTSLLPRTFYWFDDILAGDGLVLATEAWGGDQQVIVLDASDPASIFEASRMAIPVQYIAYADRTLFHVSLIGVEYFLNVTSLRDPRRPELLALVPLATLPSRLAAADGLLYMIGRDGLRVMDVSNPAIPREVGFDAHGFWANRLLPDGATVYIARRSDGLAVLDVSSCSACPVDLDGDGELTVLDFLAFQNAFDAGDQLADVDDDGQLTIFDFLVFQSLFQAGCD